MIPPTTSLFFVILTIIMPNAMALETHGKHHTELIYQGTDTISAKQYYRKITRVETKKNQALTRAQISLSKQKNGFAEKNISSLFPFTSRLLKPGLPNRSVIKGLPSPIFVIGMDKASLTWLEANIDELKRKGATGLVVQADSLSSFSNLQEVIRQRGISLEIINGDSIAEMYGIQTYPVFIEGG